MFNELLNSWNIVYNAFHDDKPALLLAVLVVLGCAALMWLTIKAVIKFDILIPFFIIFIAFSLFNFYVDVAIWTIKSFK
ncbi:hypothetical protein EXE25_18025 [Acinetobacter bouvetii]|jgi:Na+-translocating ferredoxin:NAD+ oxidoreductase RnfE subunit|uniref:Uncharacterized protein n=1 Tax=Acinetobacter bouvetii TaxID=202951 RepID=A0A4Q7ALU3_9GAMM|nr:hypothetical protein [Acinetobacter bouvetii]RZG63960.1 hypothetical protein EXE25_18025 [Acinetobacter bouvetii]